MNLKAFKIETKYLLRAFFEYRKGWIYLKHRHSTLYHLVREPRCLEKPVNRPDLSIHLPTGHNDLAMMLWAMASFYHVTETVGKLYIHEDGSFTDEDRRVLAICLPSAHIVSLEEGKAEVLKKCTGTYPTIARFRTDYASDVYLKKYVDCRFVGEARYHLVIDSDIFWFKNPQLLWDQLDASRPKSFMMDGSHARCYIRYKTGEKIADHLAALNSGIIFYDVNNFPAAKLEELFNRFDDSDRGNFYFLDQTSHAYCLEATLEALPNETYHIRGAMTPQTVARHYTRPRRFNLYLEGLPKLLEMLAK